ncbi:histidine--tRNA ligase [Heliothis virescens ascovirus 3j]|uniref:Histidine--tRNA ligase n=1 Tax=Heliothis virescens ascovirus 3j TaxID=1561067 RepID=A0A2Z5UZN5_9VIRU|nr:histidine--tRNA ligase [Heliothis virescens ascovirus 3j]
MDEQNITDKGDRDVSLRYMETPPSRYLVRNWIAFSYLKWYRGLIVRKGNETTKTRCEI